MTSGVRWFEIQSIIDYILSTFLLFLCIFSRWGGELQPSEDWCVPADSSSSRSQIFQPLLQCPRQVGVFSSLTYNKLKCSWSTTYEFNMQRLEHGKSFDSIQTFWPHLSLIHPGFMKSWRPWLTVTRGSCTSSKWYMKCGGTTRRYSVNVF